MQPPLVMEDAHELLLGLRAWQRRKALFITRKLEVYETPTHPPVVLLWLSETMLPFSNPTSDLSLM